MKRSTENNKVDPSTPLRADKVGPSTWFDSPRFHSGRAAHHEPRRIALSTIDEKWLRENLYLTPFWYEKIYRLFERVAAFLMLIIFSPLMAAIAIIIKINSPGPAIFKQLRTGQNGRLFWLYKFRSMIADAPDGSAEKSSGAVWANKAGDSRVTSVGKVLRLTHLDELPQLWNVVRGELAFVGPRPERPELIAVILKDVPLFKWREIVRPGITGWAQINLGYAATVEESRQKLEYDLYYILHRSPIFDFVIILKTVLLIIASVKRKAQNEK